MRPRPAFTPSLNAASASRSPKRCNACSWRRAMPATVDRPPRLVEGKRSRAEAPRRAGRRQVAPSQSS